VRQRVPRHAEDGFGEPIPSKRRLGHVHSPGL
jgi:hypothetical protein